VFLIRASYPTGGVYASNYIIKTSSIFANTISYLKMIQFAQTPVFEISAIYSVYAFYLFLKNGVKNAVRVDLIFFTLWSIFIIQLLALSPWSFVLNRYLAFVNIDLILIYAITVNGIYILITDKFKVIKKFGRHLIMIVVFAILLTKMSVRNFFNIANYQLYSETDSEISYLSVKSLAQYVPENAVVYVNYKKGDSNIEIYEETKWHLKLFYNRNDINFEYLDDSNLCTKNPRYIFDRSSDRFLDKNILKQSKNISLVKSGESIYKPINSGIVMHSFMDRYRYAGWNASYSFDWSIYLQKGGSCIEKN